MEARVRGTGSGSFRTRLLEKEEGATKKKPFSAAKAVRGEFMKQKKVDKTPELSPWQIRPCMDHRYHHAGMAMEYALKGSHKTKKDQNTKRSRWISGRCPGFAESPAPDLPEVHEARPKLPPDQTQHYERGLIAKEHGKEQHGSLMGAWPPGFCNQLLEPGSQEHESPDEEEALHSPTHRE